MAILPGIHPLVRAADLSRRLAFCSCLVLPLTAVKLAAAAPPGPGAVDLRQGFVDFRSGLIAEAFRDWELAAEAGSARGALYLGVLYDSGQGVPQNYATAMHWYRSAAHAGSAAGAFNVGVMYDAAIGVPKDSHEASIWYGMAARRGYGRAEYNLAQLYENGTGVTRSRLLAATYYRRAMAHGIPAAGRHLIALGMPLTPKVRPATRSDDDEIQNYRRALEQFLAQSPAEAARMIAVFRNRSNQHNAFAEYDLGFCYQQGIGVARDDAQASVYYSRAAHDAVDVTLRRAALNASMALVPHEPSGLVGRTERERIAPAMEKRTYSSASAQSASVNTTSPED